jgi:hypothetical protein
MRLLMGGVLAIGLAGAAIPAAAQGLCGGVGDSGQWIGGAPETSDVAVAGAHLEQMALVLMGNEYVALFDVTAATDVRIEAEGRGAGDPVIDLRDAAGNIIASDDDSGGNGASRLEMFLDPGSYCVSMRSFDGTPMTAFVRVGLLSHEPLTDGFVALPDDGMMPPENFALCDLNTAVPMAEGAIDSMLEGGVTFTGAAQDFPYLSFRIESDRMLTITAENEMADPVIAFYDEYGSWLGENDDFNGLNSQIDVNYPLFPGTYCLSLSALSDPAAPITVTVRAFDEAAAMQGMYERAEAAPPLDGSWPVTVMGALDGRVRQDVMASDTATWFAFDVAEGGLVLVESVTANGAGDTVLTLYDDLGRQVAWNDDANNTLDSMLSVRVMPGTYLVAVRQYSATPVMTRLVFERYVLAQ